MAATAATAEESADDRADPWRGFEPGLWQRDVNVRWFIQRNYTPYDGEAAFLTPAASVESALAAFRSAGLAVH